MGSPTTLKLKLASHLPPVLADQVGLRRIVENLVRNAKESLPEGQGTVTVSTEVVAGNGVAGAGGDRILLSVSDEGCGISPEDHDRIFQDFFTTKDQGTGLGLSNVRRLVADFEGGIKVISEPGKGTTFMVSLPAATSGPLPPGSEVTGNPAEQAVDTSSPPTNAPPKEPV
jgi:signal transduction histidine kinase